MKNIKIKIAAAAMAAISAMCAAQAIPASAFQYTGTPQYASETQSNMDNYTSYWRGSTYRENSTWTRTYYNGVVVGPGYNSTNLEGSWQGMPLNSSNGNADKGLCRSMATDYFGTNVFIQIVPNARYHTAKLGDQITMHRNGVTKTVWVTYCNAPTLKVVELKNGRITYDNTYTYTGQNLYYGNQTWVVDYVTRPIKQGDANGDGYVYAERYADYYGDLEEIANLANNGIPSWKRSDVLKAAVSLDNDWDITAADHRILMYNLLQFSNGSYYYSTYGRMNGDYGYVKTLY